MNPSDYYILVVEDEEIVRYVTAQTLTGYGYNVIEACDGVDALRAAAMYDGAIHLLITDVQMPHMNGYDLIREIRIKRPDILVMIVSGETAPAFPSDAARSAEVLLKPVPPQLLLSTASELLQRADPSAH